MSNAGLRASWDWRTLSKIEATKRALAEQRERDEAERQRDLKRLEDHLVDMIAPTLPTKDSIKRRNMRSAKAAITYVERYGFIRADVATGDYSSLLTAAAQYGYRVMPVGKQRCLIYSLAIRPDLDARTIAENADD
jgi:hypothetical protein